MVAPGIGNVIKNTMLKFIVIVLAAVIFTWYFFPQFADQSLESYIEESF